MVVRRNDIEFKAIESKICLPCALVSISVSRSLQTTASIMTNLPFQAAGIERGSSDPSSLGSCEDIECMLRPGCDCALGKLVRRVGAKRKSIEQALYR